MSNVPDGLTPIGGLQPVGGVSSEGKKSSPVPPSSPASITPVGSNLTPPPPPVAGAPAVRPVSTSLATSPSSPRPMPPLRPAPQDEPEKPMRWPLYLGGALVAVIAVTLGIFALPSAPVAAPTSYETFDATDHSFGCDLPGKWKITATGKAGEADRVEDNGVVASQSDAKIDITLSTVRGLITGQLLFGSDPIPSGQYGLRSDPVYNIHTKYFKAKYKNYKAEKVPLTESMYPPMTGIVQDGNTREMIPDIRWGEFTADGNQYGFGGKRHGYRVAVGGGEYIAYIVCECSERDWPKLQPAFEHVIESIHEAHKPDVRENLNIPGGGSVPLPEQVPGFGGGM